MRCPRAPRYKLFRIHNCTYRALPESVVRGRASGYILATVVETEVDGIVRPYNGNNPHDGLTAFYPEEEVR